HEPSLPAGLRMGAGRIPLAAPAPRIAGVSQHPITGRNIFVWAEIPISARLCPFGSMGCTSDRVSVRSWVYAIEQTAAKFPFRWWGINSTFSGRHQLDEPPRPHSGGRKLSVSQSQGLQIQGVILIQPRLV